MISKEDRIKGGLYGHCIGDALGAPVEFLSKKLIQARYGQLNDYKSGFFGIPYFLRTSGSGTDDTRFALSLTKGILRSPQNPDQSIGKEFNKIRLYPLMVGRNLLLDFFFYFGDWHKTSKFVDFLLKGRTAGNGALMRSLPVALLYPSLEEVIDVTKKQATMTHWSDISTQTCVIYNTIACYLLNDIDIPTAIEKATKGTLVENFEIDKIEPNGFSVNSLKWTLHWLTTTSSFEEAVIGAINEGGDTDTIGALVGGLAGIYYGYESIPAKWRSNLKSKKAIDKLLTKMIH